MFGRISLYTVLVLAIVGALSMLTQLPYETFEDVFQGASVERATPTAASWVLFDPETGAVHDGVEIDTVRPIASVTKLFTAYASVKSGKLKEWTVINWNDLYTEGRSGKLSHGDRVTLRDLLFPLLIESSNDAGTALERALGPSFHSEISALSETLNLEHTRIVDGSGLSSQNVSTTRELAVFYSYLRREAALPISITTLPLYIKGSVGLVNNDPARAIPGFQGGKHGYTDEAGRTFIGTFLLPDTGEEIGIAFLGSEDITHDIELLLSVAARQGMASKVGK